MDMNAKRKVVIGAAAALLLVGAGGAYAAGRLSSPKEEHQAVINDAAKRLGVEPAKLNDALDAALKDRVDAAVAAGSLSKAEGDALKARIDSGDAPFLFGAEPRGPGFERHVVGPGLDAAAKYLGLTEAELRAELQNGKTLAEIATAQDRTVDGQGDAVVADAKTKLDTGVKAGKLTQSQADEMLAELREHVSDFVNGTLPAKPFGPGGFGHHAKPDLQAAATYLGVTQAELRAELQNGKTLAEIATA